MTRNRNRKNRRETLGDYGPPRPIGKYTTERLSPDGTNRAVSVSNCHQLGTLVDYRDGYRGEFGSFDPLPGAFMFLDLTSGKSFIGEAKESLLKELDKLALAPTKGASERSPIEDTIAESGLHAMLVHVFPLGDGRVSELKEMTAEMIRNLKPELNELTDYSPGDVVELIIHDPSDAIAVTIVNRTKSRTRVFTSIDAASEVVGQSKKWFKKMGARYQHEMFEMRVNQSGKLEFNVAEAPDGFGVLDALLSAFGASHLGTRGGSSSADSTPTGKIEELSDVTTDEDGSEDDSDASEASDDSDDSNGSGDSDGSEGTGWMLRSDLTFATGQHVPGGPGSMMIAHASKKKYRTYPSDAEASEALEIPRETLARLIEEHKSETFTVSAAVLKKLRRAPK